MRGDRPYTGARAIISETFTPHARGSTLLEERRQQLLNVYPACAGIDHERNE